MGKSIIYSFCTSHVRVCILVLLKFLCFGGSGQTSLKYQLINDFEEINNQHGPLLQLENEADETGYFDSFLVPETTCPLSFGVPGYHFFDNAGLRFDNDEFISCEYSIQFTFHIKELSGPQNWVRLLNFTPSDDNGIYIKLTNAPLSGTLEFWPNGTVGAANFFNSVDLYQFVITRTCAGLVNIYVNGNFFASYDDSTNPLYLIQSDEEVIDFFQDDTAVPNEASPGWVKNIVISDFAYTETFIEEEWDIFCEVLQETDCAGTPNGSAITDECGICLEANDPNFNLSCTDCAGVVNGTSILDECGVCLEMANPDFNQSCVDCAGIPNGTSIIDDCGNCNDPNSPMFNQSCKDCAGIVNGSSILDECGVCLLPDDPQFNQSCLDCAGVIDGTSIVDECGICLEADSSDFNKSCTIQFFFPSSFSPNEDGINDYFEFFKSDDAFASVRLFRIYSRWGEKIFESSNFEFGDQSKYWDGSFNGVFLDNGIYIYYTEILFENGTVQTLSGDVLILK